MVSTRRSKVSTAALTEPEKQATKKVQAAAKKVTVAKKQLATAKKAQQERKTPEGKKNAAKKVAKAKKKVEMTEEQKKKVLAECKKKDMTVSKNGKVCRYQTKCNKYEKRIRKGPRRGECLGNLLTEVKRALADSEKKFLEGKKTGYKLGQDAIITMADGKTKNTAMYLGARVINGKKQNAFYVFSKDRKSLKLLTNKSIGNVTKTASKKTTTVKSKPSTRVTRSGSKK